MITPFGRSLPPLRPVGLALLLGCAGKGGSEDDGYEITDFTLYSQVRVAEYAVCALAEDSRLRCWGEGADAAPVDVEVISFDMQQTHGCAVTAAGEGTCWAWANGLDEHIQEALVIPEGPFSAVATSTFTTCWLTIEGQTLCIGDDYAGEGDPPGEPLASISGGSDHYCGTTTTDGLLTCWGQDRNGSVEAVPALVPLAYDAGASTTCVIDTSGIATCYGITPHVADWPNPYTPAGTFLAVVAHAEPCFIDGNGSADCAYDIWSGCDEQVGPFHAISAYLFRVCAARDDGGILCWMEDPERIHEADSCIRGEPATLF